MHRPAAALVAAPLAALAGRSDDAGPGGSAYVSGWYGYVDKDLRTLVGETVRGPFSRRYCSAGALATCRKPADVPAAHDLLGPPAALELAQDRDPLARIPLAQRNGAGAGLKPGTSRS